MSEASAGKEGRQIEGQALKEKNISNMESNMYERRFKQLLLLLPVALLLSITLSVMLGPVTIDMVTVWRIVLSYIPFIGDSITVDWSSAQQNIIW